MNERCELGFHAVMMLSVLVVFAAAEATAGEVKTGVPAEMRADDRRLGLRVDENGVLIKDGKPYRGIGVNYFEAFYRTLKDPKDTSYREGFKALAEHKIPFVRFSAAGFWPSEWELYLKDKEQYFKLLDGVVKAAEESGVGLIPSFFWHAGAVPDLVGEPLDQWGNPRSKTHKFMRQYTREIVTRYKNSAAIWGWEFGNEYNLGADLPNASEHRAHVEPELGTAKSRSERDDLTHDMIRAAFAEFAKEVRKYDNTRVITSGNSNPRPSAWHQRAELTWKQDTEGQYAEMLLGDNPDPMDMISIHLYAHQEERFNRVVNCKELLKTALDAAVKAKKPLFVGEFGVSEKLGPELVRKRFTEMLATIEKSGVPLTALWVYDYPLQKGTGNVTAANNRAYQLKAIQQANQRIRR